MMSGRVEMSYEKRRTRSRWIFFFLVCGAAGVLAVTGRPRALYRTARITLLSAKQAVIRLKSGTEKSARELKKLTTEPLCRQTMANLAQAANLYYARKAVLGNARYPSSLEELKRENLLVFDPVCQAGGRYIFTKTGAIRCSIHGGAMESGRKKGQK
jgi:hypothetical protein